MDKIIDERFERVQKALANVIDSLVKNNPSPALIKELKALLERHQNNWARIQKLREETADNDAKIKDTLSNLWTMRKELKATPTTTYARDSPAAPFTMEELLAFARRIATHSRPAPGMDDGIESSKDETSPGAAVGEAGATAMATGSFNASAGPSAAPTPSANGDSQPGDQPSQATAGTVSTVLPDSFKPAMNVNAGRRFFPWPTEDEIKIGALAQYQLLVNQGIDPKGFDPAEEHRRKLELEQQQKDLEEQQRLERETRDQRMREERERMHRERQKAREEQQQRGGGEGSAPPVVEKKQFQFMAGLDDDDDDDDED